jgi:hypothetical protein
MTQKQKILKELKSGKELTSMDGFRMGIVRMTNRINELRESGAPIKDEWKTSADGARYKVYSL